MRKRSRRHGTQFTCKCGKIHRFTAYVYAHWRDGLKMQCECGRVWMVASGVVTFIAYDFKIRVEKGARA